MIKRVTDTRLLSQAFDHIFKTLDPFTQAAQPDVPVRRVLYPTFGYHLDANQYEALTGALFDCGEQEFFISIVEYELKYNGPFTAGDHWICESPSYTEYTNLPLVLENALYSINGLWGILVSHENHALMACHTSFWDVFQKYYPDWEQDQKRFVEYWKYNQNAYGSDISWLQDFLDSLTPPATGKPEI
jgi:hypothetical protein